MWRACFEVRQRPRQKRWSANTAMLLSRRRKDISFIEYYLRPGDGERWKDANSRLAKASPSVCEA